MRTHDKTQTPGTPGEVQEIIEVQENSESDQMVGELRRSYSELHNATEEESTSRINGKRSEYFIA